MDQHVHVTGEWSQLCIGNLRFVNEVSSVHGGENYTTLEYYAGWSRLLTFCRVVTHLSLGS